MSDVLQLVPPAQFSRPAPKTPYRMRALRARALAGEFSPLEAAAVSRRAQTESFRVRFRKGRIAGRLSLAYGWRNVPAEFGPVTLLGRATYALGLGWVAFRAFFSGRAAFMEVRPVPTNLTEARSLGLV